MALENCRGHLPNCVHCFAIPDCILKFVTSHEQWQFGLLKCIVREKVKLLIFISLTLQVGYLNVFIKYAFPKQQDLFILSLRLPLEFELFRLTSHNSSQTMPSWFFIY